MNCKVLNKSAKVIGPFIALTAVWAPCLWFLYKQLLHDLKIFSELQLCIAGFI